jgi:hypothetical protein
MQNIASSTRIIPHGEKCVVYHSNKLVFNLERKRAGVYELHPAAELSALSERDQRMRLFDVCENFDAERHLIYTTAELHGWREAGFYRMSDGDRHDLAPHAYIAPGIVYGRGKWREVCKAYEYGYEVYEGLMSARIKEVPTGYELCVDNKCAATLTDTSRLHFELQLLPEYQNLTAKWKDSLWAALLELLHDLDTYTFARYEDGSWQDRVLRNNGYYKPAEKPLEALSEIFRVKFTEHPLVRSKNLLSS